MGQWDNGEEHDLQVQVTQGVRAFEVPVDQISRKVT